METDGQMAQQSLSVVALSKLTPTQHTKLHHITNNQSKCNIFYSVCVTMEWQLKVENT